MAWLRELGRRLVMLLRRDQFDAHLDEEMRLHRELREQEQIERGLSPEEAHRVVQLRFGNPLVLREESRDMWGWNSFEHLIQDVRYGFRMLRKNPSFTFVCLLTLALGIGANTAIFSVVNAVLLKPLPYPDPQRLVTMRGNQSRPDVADVAAQSQAFEGGGGVTLQAMDFTGGPEPVRVEAGMVHAGLFKALGVQPALGRAIAPEEDVVGGPQLVLLSHGFWQQNLGGDGAIVGKTIPLSGNSYTVVGVMPRGFALPEFDADVLVSLRVAYPDASEFRGVHFMRTYWRLKPGVTLGQAQAEMLPIDRRLAEQYPTEDKGRQTLLIPLQERVVGNTRTALLVLFGAVALLLLVACANFAGLLLTRAVSRQQEIVIRAALGAGRGRLIRQLLTENLLLALAGGAAGLILAKWGINLLLSLKPANLARLSGVGVDLPVLLFTLAVSLVTGGLFGLAPAWSAVRSSVSESLRERGQSATAGGVTHRLRNELVVAELAMALVLLAGAGLLIQGFRRLRMVDPGFDPQNVLTMELQLPQSRYAEVPRQTQFRRQLLEGLNSLRDLQAAMISEIPLGGDFVYHDFLIEGRPPLAPGDEPEIQSRSVMGDYFRIMRIRLLAGRTFTPLDREGSPMVGIVNEAAVKQYFPDRNPIGARIRWAREAAPRWFTIIGVVGDVKHFGLNQPDQPALYNLYPQDAQPWKRWMHLVIRTRGNPVTMVPGVKKEVWKVDDQIPLTHIQAMSEVLGGSLAERRFNMLLMGVFAALALVLAAVGIYGVISYTVTQRTHEIGIRMALGAHETHVLTLVAGQGAVLTVAGLFLGLIASLGLTRLMVSLLFGVGPEDPATFVCVMLVLAGVALAASYIPARRATKVDPMSALRHE
jgi:predicted permease